MFGRWELPALVQTASAVATAMVAGHDVEPGVPEPDRSGRARPTKRRIRPDQAAAGRRVGDVITEPRERYAFGDTVIVEFAGAHPGNDVRRGGTFVEVQ
jgi:neutral ceramidase